MDDAAKPLTDAERDELERRLAALPDSLEPLDLVSLDGYLCGVLLQPQAVAAAQWLPAVFDIDGRALPADVDGSRIAALAQRRHAELDRAIDRRQWFDPWIYELDEASPAEAQLPWVAGFATAMDRFPALMAIGDPALLEPLAVLYAAFDPEDLEDADELLAIIETLEPPADMAQAAEDLVRSVLLIADIARPRRSPRPAAGPRGPRRPARPPRRS